jgi:TolB-like protein/tetratricopeptide (TPR) repeat protein/tRNA A-37 threonylcarbamoyl transferase component Bud32
VERERWRQVEAVFQAAQERAPDERAAFLDETCSGDPELRQEVESLLRAATDTRFLESPAAVSDATSRETPSARAGPELLDRLQRGLGSTYQVERELGGGGMARIFVATDSTLGRRVVLKVLAPDLAAGLDAERFHREVRLAASLQHPHIVPLHAAGQADGLLYYTMPFVAGESLRHRLNREGPLPIGEIVRLLKEVTDALGFAHRRGIIHRDLKPANILLEEGHALVADFGIAKALVASTATEGVTQTTTLTSTGLVLGTPAYMAPEQATSDQTADHRADLYALGCLGYELLTGRPPFQATSVRGLLTAHLIEPPTPVTVHRPDVPPGLASLIMGLLAKDPDRRPQTASEVLKALETTEQSSGVEQPSAASAHPAGFGARLMATAKFVVGSAAHPRGAMVVGAAILALIVGALVMARRGGSAPAAPAAGPQMLAVLPFKNLGLPGDQYFADGLTEEITSRLATVGDLGVISRTSADRYRNSTATLRQIGRELGVGYVLEGSVRWEKRPDGTSRLRVTPQLIRVQDDRHLWADRFDADLQDVFEVQTGIAEKVTTALGGVIMARAPGQPAERPTTNLSAYDAYLRGDAAMPTDLSSGAEGLVNAYKGAAEHYQEAVNLDSTFALAYAKLGRALLGTNTGDSLTASRARAAIERALALAPDLSDAHLARGEYAGFEQNTARALKELETAVRLRPNDAEALMQLGNTEWNLRGAQSEGIAHVERAAQLDPRTVMRQVVLAFLYQEAHRFDESERTYDRAIALKPENPGPYTQKAVLYLYRGDINGARRLIRRAAERTDSMGLITAAASTLILWHSYGILDDSYQKVALGLPVTAFAGDTAFYGVLKAHYYRMRGDSTRYRAYFDTAYAFATARLRESPQHVLYGMVVAGTLAAHGRRAEAYAAHERVFPNAWRQPGELEARLCVLAGDNERALDVLEQRHWGNELTLAWLRVDPFWDPLRKYPRFQRLLRASTD